MSSHGANRETLVAALMTAMRESSGQGVLYSQAVAARLGVSGTDLECLDHVLSGGPSTAGALARATGLTTGAITGVIDRLERAGLARRAQDPDDRRKVLVEALPGAAARVFPLFAPMQAAVTAVLESRGDAELALVIDFLTAAAAAARQALAALEAGDT